MIQRNVAQGRLIKQRYLARRRTGLWQAIIKTTGQRARFAMAGFVRMLAGLVPGDHFQYPQRHGRGAVRNQPGRVQGQFASWGFRREKEHLVQSLGRQSLEHREQRANGLADPGRRLGHQATTGTDGLEHRLGQVPLPGPEAGMGKGQSLGAAVARLAMVQFLFGPGQEQGALLLEEYLSCDASKLWVRQVSFSLTMSKYTNATSICDNCNFWHISQP